MEMTSSFSYCGTFKGNDDFFIHYGNIIETIYN